MSDETIQNHNRTVWNQATQTSYGRYAKGVSSEDIAAAQQGTLRFTLTDTKLIPRDWLPNHLFGLDILCLASGGGQQAPLLAAAGASVTVLDLSPVQLQLDRDVADREGLPLRIVEGDMRDLSAFADASFDVIVHPVANCFVPEVQPIWHECFRVLRSRGVLVTGFINPDSFIFDTERLDRTGELIVAHKRPYREVDLLTEEEREERRMRGEPLHFGHSLQAQLGGQLEAGFVLTGFYEDTYQRGDLMDEYMPSFFATRALKPSQ